MALNSGKHDLSTGRTIQLGGASNTDNAPVFKGRMIMSCLQIYDDALSVFHIKEAKSKCWEKDNGMELKKKYIVIVEDFFKTKVLKRFGE